jgi:branched-chain amino acid transport system permease protein
LRATDYWRAVMGFTILLLVLAFPQGVAGALGQGLDALRGRGARGPTPAGRP